MLLSSLTKSLSCYDFCCLLNRAVTARSRIGVKPDSTIPSIRMTIDIENMIFVSWESLLFGDKVPHLGHLTGDVEIDIV